MSNLATDAATVWIGAAGAPAANLIARLARRQRRQRIVMAHPEAAAAGAGLGGARLAVLDLRPGSGFDRALLPDVARGLLAAGCAALMLADGPGLDTFTPPELVSAYAAALAAARAAAADRARLARSWLGTIHRPATATTLADGRVIAASAEMLRLLGGDGLESLLGRPFAAFLAGSGAAAGPAQPGAAGTAPAPGGGVEVEILRPDGGRVPAHLFDHPLRRRGGTAGREIALVAIADDGGIRGALAASEQRYRLVVDALAEGVLVCGPDGKVQLWNPAAERILGVPNQGVVGRNWIDGSWELSREDGSPFAVDDLPLARTLRTGEPHSGVVVGARRPGGSLRWLSINSRSLGAAPGRSLGAVASFSDVTEQKRLVERLARIEHQEQVILDSVPAYIWFKDRENRVLRINRHAAEALGMPAAEVSGRSTFELYPQEAASYHRDDLEVIATGAPKLGILELLHTPAGEPRWLHTSKVPYFDKGGSVAGVVVLSMDVTERHLAEERLRLLESVSEQISEGILVISAGEPRRIVYVNPACLAITGYPREELLALAPQALVTEGTAVAELERLRQCVAAGEPFHGEVVSRGNDELAGRHLDLRLEPLRGKDGAITHWVALSRDVTAQKAAESEQLRLREMITRSAREWQRTFDSIAMPVLLVDTAGRVSRLNQAARQLAGASFQETVRQQVDSLAAKGEPWCGVASLVGRMTPGAPPVAARERRVQNGRTWEIQTHPLPGDAGMIVTLHEQSDLVRLQESLRRSATMSAMGLLVAGVAHEVRNPLFGLGALLDSFESQTDPQQRFPIDLFRRGLTRVQNLMQQLLDYGQPVPQLRSRHALRKTLLEAAETCSGLAIERQVEVALAAPPDLPLVTIDEGRMLQVFSNLLDNAIHYSPARGQVIVTAAAEQDWLETHVDDAGPGVAAEDLGSVFEPFFTRRRGGTGLGLAIVQKIVVEHGGTVTCSRRVTGGTRMTVRLPLREAQDGRDGRNGSASERASEV